MDGGGPSRSFFPAPFRIQECQRSSTPARYSSPSFLPPRFRSSSVVSRSAEEEVHRAKRHEAVQRLKSAWELLAEKYGSIDPEDDDEIDIRTGQITKDRGRLKKLEKRDFGEFSESEAETIETEAPEVDSDEDELGAWGERSGLDLQTPAPEDRAVRRMLTKEDEEDLEDFLRAEAEMRRQRSGGESSRSRGESEYGSMSDGESSGSSNERGDLLSISPRRYGTRVHDVSLDDLFADEEVRGAQSEDELLAMDSDADEVTRVTPVSRWSPLNASASPSPSPAEKSSDARRYGKSAVRVVIPIRGASRRPERPAVLTHRRHIPSPVPDEHPIQLPQTPRALEESPPSLRSLFTTPPCHSPPARSLRSASPSSHPPNSPSPARPPSPSLSFRSPSPPAHYFLPSSPPRIGDPSLTNRDLGPSSPLPSRTPASIVPTPCTFKSPPIGEPPPRHQSSSASRLSPSFGKTRHTTPSLRALKRMASEVPRDNIDRSIYYTTRHYSNTGGINRCPVCRDAGGERLENAAYCKGRHGGGRCPFVGPRRKPGRPRKTPAPKSDSEVLTDPVLVDMNVSNREAFQPAPVKRPRGRPRKVKPVVTLESLFGTPDPSARPPESAQASDAPPLEPIKRKRGRPPKARNIELTTSQPSALGDAPVSAVPEKKRGRPPKLRTPLVIPAIDTVIGSTIDSIALTQKAPRRRGRPPRKATVDSDADTLDGKDTEYLPGEEDDAESIADDEASPIGTTMRLVPRSQTVPSLVLSNLRNTHKPSTTESASGPMMIRCNIRAGTTGLTGETASGLPDSGNLSSSSAIGSKSCRTKILPTLPITPNSPRETSGAPRLVSPSPPSSPPLFGPPHRPVSVSRLVSAASRPTPSPSISLARQGSSPSIRASSPPLRHIVPLLSSAVAIHPTPPPSSTGPRSTSVSSDHVPLHLPRKSILRRPSDASSSDVPRTVKRTRFSLQPRSPVRDCSSDPIYPNEADELALDATSSPASCFPSSSPLPRYCSSSSPFSREISVRAADVGFNLGPAHTGHLPTRLIKALVPSLQSPLNLRPTLASSMINKPGVPAYALPTPPPSFASTTSSASRRTTSPSMAGLMLPPPIPVKGVPNGQPKSMRTATPSITPEPSRPIPFTIRPSSVQPRARSRSVSLAPIPRKLHVLPARVPATTPRKRWRSELDLAKVAAEVGDDAGLEWGMDEEVGEEVGRLWREGSVVRYVHS